MNTGWCESSQKQRRPLPKLVLFSGFLESLQNQKGFLTPQCLITGFLPTWLLLNEILKDKSSAYKNETQFNF